LVAEGHATKEIAVVLSLFNFVTLWLGEKWKEKVSSADS